MMHTWALLERTIGDIYLPTGETCQAESFGKAVELLLPAEVCASRGRWSALLLDVELGDFPPRWTNLRAPSGDYRVIPIADVEEAVETDAAAIVEGLRHRGIVS